jgi:hypothetical protein
MVTPAAYLPVRFFPSNFIPTRKAIMENHFFTVADAYRRGTEDAHRIDQRSTFGPA